MKYGTALKVVRSMECPGCWHPIFLARQVLGEILATIIDGKAVAAQVRAEVAVGVNEWVQQGHDPPHLAVVLVGDNPASASYVRGKMRASREAGIAGDTLRFPADLTEDQLLDVVRDLGENPNVDGILVQLPLPAHINANRIINALNPDKDVDGLHVVNAGRLATGQPGFVPCTPAGIAELLRRSDIPIAGRHAVIIGRSNLVGRPLASLMLQKGYDATVTVCHSRTEALAVICQSADILVAAVGRAHFVTADLVRPGAAVIDVGINRISDATRKSGSRLTGDVDFAAAQEVAGWITPVPGGVGPMTIAMLLSNTLLAARRRRAQK